MPNAKINLLVVDDEPSIRMLMSHIFTQLGHRVRTAEDGFSALLEIRQEVPDVILSDLNMPGMSGFELLSIVRRRFPSIQVIAMSGAFSGPAVPAGVAAHAFYEKATSLVDLLQIVNAFTCRNRTYSTNNAPRPSRSQETDTIPQERSTLRSLAPSA